MPASVRPGLGTVVEESDRNSIDTTNSKRTEATFFTARRLPWFERDDRSLFSTDTGITFGRRPGFEPRRSAVSLTARSALTSTANQSFFSAQTSHVSSSRRNSIGSFSSLWASSTDNVYSLSAVDLALSSLEGTCGPDGIDGQQSDAPRGSWPLSSPDNTVQVAENQYDSEDDRKTLSSVATFGKRRKRRDA